MGVRKSREAREQSQPPRGVASGLRRSWGPGPGPRAGRLRGAGLPPGLKPSRAGRLSWRCACHTGNPRRPSPRPRALACDVRGSLGSKAPQSPPPLQLRCRAGDVLGTWVVAAKSQPAGLPPLRVCGQGEVPLAASKSGRPDPSQEGPGGEPWACRPPPPLVLSYPSISGLRIPETCWATRPFRSDWKPRSMSTEKLPEENAAECLRRFHLWCVKIRLISVSLFYAFPCFPSSTRYYIKIQILNYEKIEKAGF